MINAAGLLMIRNAAKKTKAIINRAQTMVPGDNLLRETFKAMASTLHIRAAIIE